MTDDSLLEAVRKELRAMFRKHDSLEDAAILRWSSGKRKPNSWFYRLSKVGCATSHYGDGCKVFRAARDAVSHPLGVEQRDEALAVAVDVLNRLGFLMRYGGLATQNVASYGVESDEIDIFTHSGVADLGAALALLENFGCQPRPTPAEKRHNERVMRAWQEGRDNG